MDIVAVIKAPMEDKDWIKTCGLMGLFMFVPIIGALNILGWMEACFEGRRHGNRTLPPANFSYIGRGFSFFLTFLPVIMVFFALATLAILIMAPMFSNTMTQGNAKLNEPPMMLLLVFAFGGISSLFLAFITPAIYVVHMAEGRSFASARLGSIFGVIRKNIGEYFMLWLVIFLAQFIAQLGVIACGVGVLVTMPLHYAIIGYAVADYQPKES